MDEKEIMDLITSEYSWEQVIHKIIAWEGLDPWDLDLNLLSKSFLQYIKKLKQLDFKIPAKYIIIVAVLLRMKSDHLEFIDLSLEDDAGDLTNDLEEDNINEIDTNGGIQKFEINPINVPPKRVVQRKIMINELILALKKAIKTKDRRTERRLTARKQIVLKKHNLILRIDALYERIDNLLKKIKNEEVKFSSLVDKWEKKEILNAFLPLIYLENNEKVKCRQPQIFNEIFIKRAENK